MKKKDPCSLSWENKHHKKNDTNIRWGLPYFTNLKIHTKSFVHTPLLPWFGCLNVKFVVLTSNLVLPTLNLVFLTLNLPWKEKSEMLYRITNIEEEKWEEEGRFGGEGIQNESLDKSLCSLVAMLLTMVQIEGRFDGDDGWEWKWESENKRRRKDTTLTTTI